MVRQSRAPRRLLIKSEMKDDTRREVDAAMMRRAIELAGRGQGRVSPNPLVGAVITRDDRIVGEGWHTEYGQPHAEVEAIRAAGALAADSTLYVTLEPCAHWGRTGPCVDAIREAKVRRVVYASTDPNPVAGGGAAALEAAGVDTTGGVEEDAARRLNPEFFHRFDPDRGRRPWIELKLALSLDGRIADASGTSQWITGEAAREEVHRLRAGADAIAIGIGTALADDPTLTVRGSVTPRVAPTRVVFDRRLRLPLSGRLVRSAKQIPVIVVAAPGAEPAARMQLEEAGVRVIEAGDLPGGLRALRDLGIRSMFFEGGAGIASSLLAADLVDRLTLFHAPVLIGPAGADPFRGLHDVPLPSANRWKLVRTGAFGTDTLTSVDR